MLTRFRPDGHDIQNEVLDIQRNAQETRAESFWGSIAILYSRRHWKQASAALLIPFFQQFTGMNAIMFYGDGPPLSVGVPFKLLEMLEMTDLLPGWRSLQHQL